MNNAVTSAAESPDSTTTSGSGRMLFAFLRRYPARSGLVLIALLASSLLDGVGLSAILTMLSQATESITSDGSLSQHSLPEQWIAQVFSALGLSFNLFNLLIFSIVIMLFKVLLVLVANRQVGYAVAQVATDLRLDLLRAVVNSRWRYYLSKPLGSLSNAMATEAQRASEGYLQGAVMATQIISAAIYTMLALMISWQFSLAALGLSLLVLLSLNLLVRIAGKAGRQQTGLLKSILTVMTDQLTAIKPLKAMAREHQMDTILTTQTEDLNQALRKQVFSKEAMKALQEGLLVILAAIGLYIMLARLDMQAGAVMILILLLVRITGFLSKAQRAWQETAISESAFWSLTEAIDEARVEHEPRHGLAQPELSGQIRFRAVSFSHPGKPVFDQVNFDLPVRKLSVIVGPSGVGKTTLIDLVVGLLEPDAGEIIIGQTPLQTLDQFQWRRMIGYVPQEALLVNDTIAKNITLGSPELSDQDVREALNAADALEFVEQMPHGIHTMIGERGGQLSGGQRQRLAIARALVQRPALLILDEATSNLDQGSEQAVLRTIERLKGSLTMLAVTHHQPLKQIADIVLQLDQDGIASNSHPSIQGAD